MSSQTTKQVYAGFTVLVLFDLVLVLLSESFRNAIGNFGTSWWMAVAVRSIPDVLLLCILLPLRFNHELPGRLCVVLPAAFTVLGLFALVPWIGMFAVLLTPIAVLYFASILWISHGYVVATTITIVFIVLTAIMTVAAARKPVPTV